MPNGKAAPAIEAEPEFRVHRMFAGLHLDDRPKYTHCNLTEEGIIALAKSQFVKSKDGRYPGTKIIEIVTPEELVAFGRPQTDKAASEGQPRLPAGYAELVLYHSSAFGLNRRIRRLYPNTWWIVAALAYESMEMAELRRNSRHVMSAPSNSSRPRDASFVAASC